jgi:23S rRNA (guanosine2251-2'-O)-methyltransferase
MDDRDTFIYGVQPVLEALRAKKKIERIYIARERGAQTEKIRIEAEKQHIKVTPLSKDELSKKAGLQNHQGVIASVVLGGGEAASIAKMLDLARSRNEPPLVLLLDQIQDPQNLGALIRSAYALGAHGVVIPQDRAASVTPAVIRASAGAALHVQVARVVNLKHALRELQEAGVWSAAAVLDGDPAFEARLDGPLAIVIGSEGKGVRPTLADDCDLRVSIPLPGGLDSLNASVAGAILLYEALRQRSRTP